MVELKESGRAVREDQTASCTVVEAPMVEVISVANEVYE